MLLRKRLKGSSVLLKVLCLACWWLYTLHVSTAKWPRYSTDVSAQFLRNGRHFSAQKQILQNHVTFLRRWGNLQSNFKYS